MISSAYHFEPVNESHLPILADILNYYVLNSTATFHTQTLSADDMREKAFFSNPIYGTFLIKENDNICGYCSLTMWKKQEAYRHTAEISIYLNPEFCGKGIGSAAIKYLENMATKNDIQTLMAGCSAENTPSIKLFEKNGFIQCAHFKKMGIKFGRVLDTIYLQKHI